MHPPQTRRSRKKIGCRLFRAPGLMGLDVDLRGAQPHRVRMTHNLVVNYGLYRQMEVFRPKPVSRDQMTRFHSDDYINFLRVINPDNMSEYLRHLQRCKSFLC